MKALYTGIYNKFTGSALDTALSNRLYNTALPEGELTYPYGLFFIVYNTPSYPGGKTIEQSMVQFSLFSSLSSQSEIGDLLGNLWSLYDDAVLTITGYSPIYFIRGNLSVSREEIQTQSGAIGVWQYDQEYNLWNVLS